MAPLKHKTHGTHKTESARHWLNIAESGRGPGGGGVVTTTTTSSSVAPDGTTTTTSTTTTGPAGAAAHHAQAGQASKRHTSSHFLFDDRESQSERVRAKV